MNALIGPQDDRNPYLNLRRISQERSFAKAADYAGKNVLVLGIGGLGSQLTSYFLEVGLSLYFRINVCPNSSMPGGECDDNLL